MQANINGVNVNRLKETVSAIEKHPGLGKFSFRVSNRWVHGAYNHSAIQGFYGGGQEDDSRKRPFILGSDKPEMLLGEDTEPNPAEYVLHALAGCLTQAIVYHAAAKGYHLEKVESTLVGNLDLGGFLGTSTGSRNGYEAINIQFIIEGDLTDEQKKEILQLGPRFSPVFDIITNKVPVSVSLLPAHSM
jgi:uncharacterized OsmC-like protein